MKKALLIIFILTLIPFQAFAQTFEDVQPANWYFGDVEELVTAGIIDNGSYFRPNDPLNRAELLKMILKAIDTPDDFTLPETPNFKDVPKEAWYYEPVEAAAARGIIEGYKNADGTSAKLFGPADSVNRAAAAKILVNAFDIPTSEVSESPFPDVTASDWFFTPVLSAYHHSILSGYQNGNFGPADSLTRAQAAKMIVNAMGYHEGQNTPEPQEENSEENQEEKEAEKTEEEQTEEESESSGTEENAPAAPNSAPINEITVTPGTEEVYLARYDFSSLYEGTIIDTLTVVNDTTGNNFGDDPLGTIAVKNITLKYPDQNGYLRTKSAALSGDGTARFSDLGFYIARYENAFLEIYADFSSMNEAGELLSGAVVRLGIQNVNNTDSSFRALGATSNEVLSLGSRISMSSSSTLKTFVVRKSVPVLGTTNEGLPLITGENNLIKFSVTADERGGIALGRLVFDVNVNDSAGGDLTLGDFRLFRDGIAINDKVNIYNATAGADIKTPALNTISNGSSRVIVSFNEEETISAGQTANYRLQATVMNTDSGDMIITRFGRNDEDTPLSGLTANTNPNMGRIFKAGDATEGIFTGATDFSQSAVGNRDIIWSDRSADSHSYPGITAGTVADGTGSYDWTNGYSLEVYDLSDSILSR